MPRPVTKILSPAEVKAREAGQLRAKKMREGNKERYMGKDFNIYLLSLSLSLSLFWWMYVYVYA